MNTFVSVIIPVYNYSSFIIEAVNSVLNQSYQNFELIIVDDCSIDDTYKKLTELNSNKRCTIIRHDNNSGVSSARNTGIKMATGKYIAFLDGDDLWLPQKLELQIKFLEHNSELGFTNCGGYFFGTIESPFYAGFFRHVKKLDIDLLYHCAIPAPMSCIIVRKSILDEVGYFDERLHYAEDRDILLRLIKHTSFKPCDIHAVRIRKHNNSYAHNNMERFISGQILFMKKSYLLFSLEGKIHWHKVMANMLYSHSYLFLNAHDKKKAWQSHWQSLYYNPFLLFTLKYHIQTIKCFKGRKNSITA